MRYCLLSCVAIAASTGIVAAAGSDTEARSLLARALKAHGGEETLARFKGLRLRLKISYEGVRQFSYQHDWLFSAPDQFRDTGDGYYLGRKLTTVYATDGKNTWSLIEGRTEDMDQTFSGPFKDNVHLLHVLRLTPLQSKDFELTSLGETKVEGKTAAGLRVRSTGQKDIALFFDRESGLLVKSERKVYNTETEREGQEERYYKDYPKKEALQALPFPRKIVVKIDDKTVEYDDILKVTFLEKVDETVFRRK
jgi:hypothetical protein